MPLSDSNFMKALDVPVELWDLLPLPIVCKCLNTVLHTHTVETTFSDEFPTLDQFVVLLEKNCKAQKVIGSVYKSKIKTLPKWLHDCEQISKYLVSSHSTCCLCKGSHNLHKCSEFCKRSLEDCSRYLRNINYLCCRHLAHDIIHWCTLVRLSILKSPDETDDCSSASQEEPHSIVTAVAPVTSSMLTDCVVVHLTGIRYQCFWSLCCGSSITGFCKPGNLCHRSQLAKFWTASQKN
ncbi:hypothetical protein PR048_001704 [Dryococelus australis]|uniref:Uncharacterized protein n=1 Tax=Dryococelus australis TaxID=614101 RepID=A0ABQ9II37_9NEOP|nr:hypothetical protein PR048_001704 [Dryococelus australis]